MSRSHKAFTLIELALVLIVMGILTGGGLKLVASLSKKAKITQTRDTLKIMGETLQGFMLTHDRLPTLKEWDEVILDHDDSWGKKIIYKVDPLLTAERHLCSLKHTGLQLKKGALEEINTAAVLISSGANRNMQTSVDGDLIEGAQTSAEVDWYPLDVDRKEPYDDEMISFSLHRLQTLNRCGKEKLEILNTLLPRAQKGQSYQVRLFAQDGVPFELKRYRWCMTQSSKKNLETLSIVTDPKLASCDEDQSHWPLSEHVVLQSPAIREKNISNYRLDFGVADRFENQHRQSFILNVEH